MRKLVTLGASTLFAVSAVAGPAFYGQINKEIRYVGQDDHKNSATAGASSSYTGPTSVDGYGSFIGARGSYNAKGLKIGYLAEIGTDSDQDNGGGDNLFLRQAYATVGGSFGTVTVGETWLESTLRVVSLDPLDQTGAQARGTDQANIIGASRSTTSATNGARQITGLGYNYRNFVDALQWQSKVFSNFQFTVSVDRNESSSLVPGSTNTDFYTYTLAYDRRVGRGDLSLFGTYTYQDQSAVKSDNSEKGWQLGAKYSCNKWGFSLGYGMSSYDSNGTNDAGTANATFENEYKRMFAAISHSHRRWTFALTYSALEVDEPQDSLAGTNGATAGLATAGSGDYTQIALGATYALHKNVDARFVLAQYDVELNGRNADLDTTNTGLNKDNTATSGILGLAVRF